MQAAKETIHELQSELDRLSELGSQLQEANARAGKADRLLEQAQQKQHMAEQQLSEMTGKSTSSASLPESTLHRHPQF